MASDIEQERFDDLLKELNKDYSSSKKYNWLRCLLHANLTIDQRSGHKSAIHLFKELYDEGGDCRISYTDVEILAEIAELTGQHDAITRINKYITAVGSKYTVNRGPKLTQYSRALFQSLRQVAPSELPDLVASYQLNDQASVWDLVFNLEIEQRLDATPAKIQKFAKYLNQTAKSILLDSLTQSTVTGGPQATILSYTQGGPSTVDAERLLPVSTTVELSKDDYRQLLVDISQFWERRGNVNKLKVLLCDFKRLAVWKLEGTSKPYDLLDLLHADGIIGPSNINVLIEAAVLCGLSGVEDVIKTHLPAFPGFKNYKINNFKESRQILINFGHLITTDETTLIGNLYDFDTRQFSDPWVLIFKLEKMGIFVGDKKIDFIKKLEANQLKELAALINKIRDEK